MLRDPENFRPRADQASRYGPVETRNLFAQQIEKVLGDSNIDALVLKSQDGVYPPWVRMEAWLPVETGDVDARQRASLSITIDRLPYNERATIVSAKSVCGKRELSVTNRPEFDSVHARQWAAYTLDRGSKPSNYTPLADLMHALFAAFLPFVHGPHHNPISKGYKGSFDGIVLLGLGGLGLLGFSLLGAVPAGFLIGLGAFVAAIAIASKRKLFVEVAPPAAVPPRQLGAVDSWHSVVPGLGHGYEQTKERLLKRVSNARTLGFSVATELYSHRTPTAYVECDRLVISNGQGVIHVTVQPFGSDLFIGWQSYLNWAKWAETGDITSKLGEGVVTRFRDMRPAQYVPNQFDLIDVSALADLVHRQIQEELRPILREKAIDQELDFDIIRRDRGQALDQKRQRFDKPASDASGGLWSRLRQGAASWQSKAVTESAASSDSTDVSDAERGHLTPVVVLTIAAVLLHYILSQNGFFYYSASIEYWPGDTHAYRYHPGLDFAFVATISLGMLLFSRLSLRVSGLIFAALYFAIFVAHVVFSVVVNEIYTEGGELIWTLAVLLKAIACMAVLSFFWSYVRSVSRWALALGVVGIAYLALATFGAGLAGVFGSWAVNWFTPYVLFVVLFGVWLGKPEAREE